MLVNIWTFQLDLPLKSVILHYPVLFAFSLSSSFILWEACVLYVQYYIHHIQYISNKYPMYPIYPIHTIYRIYPIYWRETIEKTVFPRIKFNLRWSLLFTTTPRGVGVFFSSFQTLLLLHKMQQMPPLATFCHKTCIGAYCLKTWLGTLGPERHRQISNYFN